MTCGSAVQPGEEPTLLGDSCTPCKPGSYNDGTMNQCQGVQPGQVPNALRTGYLVCTVGTSVSMAGLSCPLLEMPFL